MESMSWPLTPKSHSLISPLEFTRMLEGFTSGGGRQRVRGAQQLPASPQGSGEGGLGLTSVHDLVLLSEIRQAAENLQGIAERVTGQGRQDLAPDRGQGLDLSSQSWSEGPAAGMLFQAVKSSLGWSKRGQRQDDADGPVLCASKPRFPHGCSAADAITASESGHTAEPQGS